MFDSTSGPQSYFLNHFIALFGETVVWRAAHRRCATAGYQCSVQGHSVCDQSGLGTNLSKNSSVAGAFHILLY